MLACTETVTFVRLVKDGDEDSYSCVRFDGVSWFEKTRIRVEGVGMVYDNALQIRIPAASIIDQPLPETGDYILHGALPEGAEITKRADLEAFHPRKVLAVGDNRRGRSRPHVAVIGK